VGNAHQRIDNRGDIGIRFNDLWRSLCINISVSVVRHCLPYV